MTAGYDVATHGSAAGSASVAGAGDRVNAEGEQTAPPPGTRLAWVELYNWGTFHNKVARLDLDGGNTLLTGNIGAGKSTLVDALTSLVSAPNKVTYNQAAGATRTERSVRSYALGQYRNVPDEHDGSQKPEYLRTPAGNVSVILAGFARHRVGALPGVAPEMVTVGLVITFTGGATALSATPVRTYLLAPGSLGVKTHLLGHDTLSALRKAIKIAGGQWWEDSFQQYQAAAIRALNVTRQGLATFTQTVSMKQVGDLTGFVRNHMLDHADMSRDVEAMLGHYEDLLTAHDRVVDARRQLEALDKVRDDAGAYDRTADRLAVAGEVRSIIDPRVDNIRHDQYAAIIAEQDRLLPGLRARLAEAEGQLRLAGERIVDLQVQIQAAGGADLQLASKVVTDAEEAVRAAVATRRELAELASRASIAAPDDVTEFGAFRAVLQARLAELTAAERSFRTREYEAMRATHAARDELRAIDAEVAQADMRASNIPDAHARRRDELADELGIAPAELPFAGELLRVTEPRWELAAERLTRPFALTLLVPHELAPAAAGWIDRRDMGMKFVFIDVPETDPAPAGTARPDTVAGMLAVRGGTRYSRWLAAEVARRYPHVCVPEGRDLTLHRRAVSRAGQIRDGGRHEKDDRPGSSDRRRFVLGWETAARRQHLRSIRPAAERALEAAEAAAGDLDQKKDAHKAAVYAARQLHERFTDPAAVDVPAVEQVHRDAAAHRDQLAADPALAELNTLLGLAQQAQAHREQDKSRAQRQAWQAEQVRNAAATARSKLTVTDIILSGAGQVLWDELLSTVGPAPQDVTDVERWGRTLTAALEQRVASSRATLERIGRDLTTSMHAYKNEWPKHCEEVDPKDLETRHVLLARRTALEEDDLPTWQGQFKERLEKNAIQEIASFNRKLERAAATITSRLSVIKNALFTVDYHLGTYIQLDKADTVDQDVRSFRAEMREITTGAVGQDGDTYSEERFLLVRDLLDRFTGRETSAEKDRRWVAKVTDVRQWFTFAATERARETDELIERYTDSDGKSGGQKEKLAYTILAASLAYQYGLAEGEQDAFRFVMIDEAFGRGSETSTEFGLSLFASLGLQLLVVTPLQKIRTIEPHVSAVGYVQSKGDGTDRRTSELVSMSITEWVEATHVGAARPATGRQRGVTGDPPRSTTGGEAGGGEAPVNASSAGDAADGAAEVVR